MLNLDTRVGGTGGVDSINDDVYSGSGSGLLHKSGSETQQKDAMLAARRLLLIPWYQQRLANGELTAITDRLAEGIMQQPPDAASTAALSAIAEGLPVQEALEKAGILPQSARPSNSLHNMLAGLGESSGGGSSSASFRLSQHSLTSGSPWAASSPTSVSSPAVGGGGGGGRGSLSNSKAMNSDTDLTRDDYHILHNSKDEAIKGNGGVGGSTEGEISWSHQALNALTASLRESSKRLQQQQGMMNEGRKKVGKVEEDENEGGEEGFDFLSDDDNEDENAAADDDDDNRNESEDES
jgi:hypothetical protein